MDTASSYGGGYSEKVVGMGLKVRRQQAFLCTKCGIHPNKERTALEYDLKPESIRAVSYTHLDVYKRQVGQHLIREMMSGRFLLPLCGRRRRIPLAGFFSS